MSRRRGGHCGDYDALYRRWVADDFRLGEALAVIDELLADGSVVAAARPEVLERARRLIAKKS